MRPSTPPINNGGQTFGGSRSNADLAKIKSDTLALDAFVYVDPTWADTNDGEITLLAAEVFERTPMPLDELEVTALIETMGITDTVALQRYGAPNAFDLAAEVLVRIFARYQPSTSAIRPEKIPAPKPLALLETLGDYARGPLALLTALTILAMISAYAMLGGWDNSQVLVLSAGLTSSMLVTSGFAQAASRRTSLYLGMKKPKAAGRFFALAMGVAGACVGLTALLLLLISLGIPGITGQQRLTFLSAFLGLSALWLLSGGLSLVRKTVWLGIGLAAGLAAGVIVDRLVVQFTTAHLTAGTVVGFVVAMTLVVGAIYRSFYATPDATAAKKPRVAPAKMPLPPTSYLIVEAAPYFAYSALYMVFIMIPHVFGWIGMLGAGQLRMWAVTSVEVGLTLALLPIILVGGLSEHALRDFWRLAPWANANTPGAGVSGFRDFLAGLYQHYWRLHLGLMTALSLAVYLGFRVMLDSGFLRNWLQLADLSQVVHYFVAGLCIYWLIGWGLYNCMFCITLGRAGLAVRAVELSIIVTVIVGAPLSLRLNFSYSAIAFIAGAVVFVMASHLAARNVLKSSDYHYVSSL